MIDDTGFAAPIKWYWGRNPGQNYVTAYCDEIFAVVEQDLDDRWWWSVEITDGVPHRDDGLPGTIHETSGSEHTIEEAKWEAVKAFRQFAVLDEIWANDEALFLAHEEAYNQEDEWKAFLADAPRAEQDAIAHTEGTA